MIGLRCGIGNGFKVLSLNLEFGLILPIAQRRAELVQTPGPESAWGHRL